MSTSHVIDLCSEDEDENRRVVVDTIDGIPILQFNSIPEMELYINQKQSSFDSEPFLGFDKPSRAILNFFKSKITNTITNIITNKPTLNKPTLNKPTLNKPTLNDPIEKKAEDDTLDDCIIVSVEENAKPIKRRRCRTCGKCRSYRKRRITQTVSQVINLDSDDEDGVLIVGKTPSTPNQLHSKSNEEDTTDITLINETDGNASTGIIEVCIDKELSSKNPMDDITMPSLKECVPLESNNEKEMECDFPEFEFPIISNFLSAIKEGMSSEIISNSSNPRDTKTRGLFRGNDGQANGFDSPPRTASEQDAAIPEVVDNLVSFVCREEQFNSMPIPLDNSREKIPSIKLLSQKAACQKEHCLMGCICSSLNHSVEINRCSNPDCIFGCVCALLKSRLRRRNSVENTSLNDALKLKSDICGTQRENYELPVLKRSNRRTSQDEVKGIKHKQDTKRSSDKNLKNNSQSNQPSLVSEHIARVQTKVLKRARISPQSYTRSHIFKKKKKPANVNHVTQDLPFRKAASDPKKQATIYKNRYSQPTDVTRDEAFPNVKGDSCIIPPTPDFALTCLTPGIGYVTLEEFGCSVLRLQDPFNPTTSKTFTSVSLATDWLNYKLKEHLNVDTNIELKWLVSNSIMIDRKKIKRFDINVLLDPRCRITRNGVVFA